VSASAVTVRPVTREDDPFLEALFAESMGTLARGLAALPDGGAMLLGQMRRGQLESWREAYGEDGHAVVLVGAVPVGRVWTARLGRGEVRLVDIAVLEAWRGRGVGGEVLRRVLAEADAEGRSVVLHVAPGNPARRLYGRLGFVVVGGDEMHLRLERVTAASRE